MSDHLDPDDLPWLQPRGSATRTVVDRPGGAPPSLIPNQLDTPPSSQPNKTHAPLPGNLFEIANEFVKRVKIGDWRPDLDNLIGKPPKRRALVIAIKYENDDEVVTPLHGTYIDAGKIIHMLESKLSYESEDICVLTDLSELAVGPRWPSRENIQKATKWLTYGTTSDDYRFMFVASHGHRQIRAQMRDGNQTLISNEGILLRESGFIPFNKCGNCECQDQNFRQTYQETWGFIDGPRFIPEPKKVLHDAELNVWLAGSLGPGAKLTIVFDCCYAGGTLCKTLPGSVDATRRGPGSRAAPPTISQVPESDISKPFGNIVCLPLQAKIDVSRAVRRGAITQGNELASKTTKEPFMGSCYTLTDIPAGGIEFPQDCEVLCWAACMDTEFAWGDSNELGGHGFFSRAFTDMFKGEELPTYRQINQHVQDALVEFNRKKENIVWEQQHPKLFVSNNIAKNEELFAAYLGKRVEI